MTEILLRELSSSDIDWMTSVGHKQIVAMGDRFLGANETSDALHLILEGELALVSAALPAQKPQTQPPPIATYSSGDVLGIFLLPTDHALPIEVKALEKSLILSIDRQALAEKLQEASFSARFYRAIAMLLSRKQWQITAQLPRDFMLQSHLVMTKSILSVFGCLHDSDMCWMTSFGKIKRLKAGEIHVRERQPLDALDIVLQGSLALLVCEGKQNSLALAFGASQTSQHRQISQALPGEILGVTAFLDMTASLYQLQASQDSLVLSIPIAALTPKLQQDIGFASRFYRALASLTMERMFQILSGLGGSANVYEPGCSLCDQEEYEGELDIDDLQQLSLARARFNWMLQQLGVKAKG
jgi:CRP-like cAMP-binding protein